MRMATIQEAQTALAEFDRKHWPHAPGAATIQHAFLHLFVGLTDVSWSEKAGRPAAVADPGWLADHITAKRGVLIEYALRFANAVGGNLAGWLYGGGPDGGLFWLQRQGILAVSDPASNTFAAIIFGLRLAAITDYGQPLSMPSVMAIAQALMECAARSSPSDVRDMEGFLEPFAVWLAELEERFSSQPVPT